jgi:DNA-directed RNA polymerase specialized sigma24 family protein
VPSAEAVGCSGSSYFGGLTDDETAEALGMSVRTVRRDWAKARAWLVLELEDGE